MARASVAVGAKRLLKLAEFLKTVPAKRFDYNSWVGEDWKGSPDLSCGTTACALGWATQVPAFKRAGLYLHVDKDAVRELEDQERAIARGEQVFYPLAGLGTSANVRMKGSREYDAFALAANFFAISESDANYLFSPADDGSESKATPKQVARKITKYVRVNR